MAIYHLHAQIIQRSKGRCTTAAIAYRRGMRVHDQRLGKTFDYRYRSGVDHTETLAPAAAPDWVFDPEALWNEVECVERRKDAQLAREIDIALPVELSPPAQIELAKRFVRSQFVSSGMVADMAFHGLETHNPHVHIMLTLRELRPDGFGKKMREWNSKKCLKQWRSAWSKMCNQALKEQGYDTRIDHRTLQAQGVPRHPQIHLGPATVAMMRRGILTDRGRWYRLIQAANRKIEQIERKMKRLKQAIFSGLRDLYRLTGDTKAVLVALVEWRYRQKKLCNRLETMNLPTIRARKRLDVLDTSIRRGLLAVRKEQRGLLPDKAPDSSPPRHGP